MCKVNAMLTPSARQMSCRMCSMKNLVRPYGLVQPPVSSVSTSGSTLGGPYTVAELEKIRFGTPFSRITCGMPQTTVRVGVRERWGKHVSVVMHDANYC